MEWAGEMEKALMRHSALWKAIVAGFVATLLSVVVGMTPATAAPLVIGETFADISCTGGATPFVRFKGWGVDGPRSTRVHIEQVVKIGSEWWETYDNWVTSGSSGSWSGPTHTDFTFISGTYHLYVYAYTWSDSQNKDVTYIGSDSDSCKI